MEEKRKGRQTPTTSVVLPYTETKGQEAVDAYNATKRTCMPWQELLMYDILATNSEGLWTHTKIGYSVPRRNGKSEILIARELYGLQNGESILHTAHRTATSHASWERLCDALERAGIEFKSVKQMGFESVRIPETGGRVNFRTRSTHGGLGEGYDCLIIDEAQEYTTDQESALKYVVTDSMNPQTIMCGTPPTPYSLGTVFTTFRKDVLAAEKENSLWAEWSIETRSDIHDRELWYETNPSLGYVFTERSVADEIGSDEDDFLIQRLGLWIRYNQKSAITSNEWEAVKLGRFPALRGRLFVGVKYGKDGLNVAVSVAAKMASGDVFVEALDCRPIRDGSDWIVRFLKMADVQAAFVDGNGSQVLIDSLKDARVKTKVDMLKVGEVMYSSTIFEQAIVDGTVHHMGQPSLHASVTNCEHRAIGTNGGFGFRSLKDEIDVSLLDSAVIAHWACKTAKEVKKQVYSY